MEYKLVACNKINGLNHDVNNFLKEGWQLYGKHKVTMTYDPGTTTSRGELIIRYSQALVKYDTDASKNLFVDSMDMAEAMSK